MIILTYWLAFWVIVQFVVIPTVVYPHHPQPAPGPMTAVDRFNTYAVHVWAALWAIAGLVGIYLWLTIMWGNKRITVTPQRLVLETRPLGRRSAFRLDHVSKLTVMPYEPDPQQQSESPASRMVAFRYRGRTQRFGQFTEEEAKQVVEEINRRFPGLSSS
jgi:hypothetical protein